MAASSQSIVAEMVSDSDCKGCVVVKAATERIPGEETTRLQMARPVRLHRGGSSVVATAAMSLGGLEANVPVGAVAERLVG